MTPTLARMAGARAGELRKPVRWFSIPQLFRYERQQRGRLREHFQLNLDIIGEADVTADAELLAAAVEHLMERRLEEFRKAFANLPPEADRVDAAVDTLWSMFEGPCFVAWAELWVAARTDPELARILREVDDRFVAETRAVQREVYPDAEADDYGRDLAFALMDGMAFQRLVDPDRCRPAEEYLDALKAMAKVSGPGTAR
jgi:ATP phosphoribosyltransferase regulatory subunit HisZ